MLAGMDLLSEWELVRIEIVHAWEKGYEDDLHNEYLLTLVNIDHFLMTLDRSHVKDH